MEDSSTKQQSSKKIEPVEPAGSVKIAGETISVSRTTVKSKPGSSSKEILKQLKKISGKSIFSIPPYLANE